MNKQIFKEYPTTLRELDEYAMENDVSYCFNSGVNRGLNVDIGYAYRITIYIDKKVYVEINVKDVLHGRRTSQIR